MNNQTAITGTVLLEAFWSTRKKDMLDLISPFILYGVSKTTSVGNAVDVTKVTKIIRDEFGYSDIPEAVIVKVINRDKNNFYRRNKKFYLKNSLDEHVDRLENRKRDCSNKIEIIGKSLYEYLLLHCRKNKITSETQCIDFLQHFFSLFALQIGFETLESEMISRKYDEVNYYIAEYIFEKKTENSCEYANILDLTKGYLLRSAIYLQLDNSEMKRASYRNTSFYYDTPFLIQLLGFQGEKEMYAARSLHTLLKKLGARFYYFSHNGQELNSVLTAYQYSLIGRQNSYRTLEGLDRNDYKFDDVMRLKNQVPLILHNQYGIDERELPCLAVTSDGVVDVDKVDISEMEAAEYVKLHTKHYSEDNLSADIASVLGIHRLREGVASQSIEKCKAIFVTTNVDFTRAFNEYYKATIGSNRVMPVITAFDLSAITWVKGGRIDESLPEQQLLMNAYQALQPSPEVFDRCLSVLTQLETEGKLSVEEAVSLRSDRVAQKELWIEYFPSADNVDENYIEKLIEKHRKRLIGKKEAEISANYDAKVEESKSKRIYDARLQAKKIAQNKKNKIKMLIKIFTVIIFIIILLLSIVGLLGSLAVKYTIPMLFFIVVSITSIVDTIRSRGVFVGKVIDKISNYYETIIYEKKFKEYEEIVK